MNKTISSKVLGILCLTLALSACRYSNEFTGSYNSSPAKLTAFSKNTDKYCIALTLTSGPVTKNNFVSAQDVVDFGEITRAKYFNTKATPCNANMTEYLVGTRTSKILGTSLIARNELMAGNLCRVTYYNEYLYQDAIQFELRNNANDSVVGNFSGDGQVDRYTDYSRPVSYGPVYYCGPINPRPYPYPYPNGGPFPR
jgi:hypothetical protein